MSADPKAVRRNLIGDGEERAVPERKRLRLTPQQIALRRSEWAALLADNKTQVEIAEEAGVDPATVSRHIQALVRKQEEKGLASLDQKRALALAKNERLQSQVLDCFFASMEGKTVTYNEEVKQALHNMRRKERRQGKREKGQGTGKYKKYTREETSVGDIKWAQLLAELFKEENKLNGIYPREDEKPIDDLANLSPEDRAKRVTSLLEQARLARAQRISVEEGDQLRTGSIDVSAHEGIPVQYVAPVDEEEEEAPKPDIDINLKPEIE